MAARPYDPRHDLNNDGTVSDGEYANYQMTHGGIVETGEDILNTVADPMVTTDEEHEAEQMGEDNLDLLQNLYNEAPSGYDLSGMDLFGLQMPDGYINEFMASGNGTSPDFGEYSYDASGGASRGDAAISELQRRIEETRTANMPGARQAYVNDQLAKDPLAFLQVNQESALASAQADPGSIAAQNRYLGDMRSIYEQGGYTEQERSQNRLAQQDASRYEQSQRAAAQQQAAMRGMNQSGAAMMGALSAQQGGANRAADSATQFGIAGQQRALQSLMNYGQQANQMRQSSWNEDTARRGALDSWNQYRTGQINQRAQQMGGAQGTSYGMRTDAANALIGGRNDSIDRREDEENRNSAGFYNAIPSPGSMTGGG
jgi:hypothetical protein